MITLRSRSPSPKNPVHLGRVVYGAGHFWPSLDTPLPPSGGQMSSRSPIRDLRLLCPKAISAEGCRSGAKAIARLRASGRPRRPDVVSLSPPRPSRETHCVLGTSRGRVAFVPWTPGRRPRAASIPGPGMSLESENVRPTDLLDTALFGNPLPSTLTSRQYPNSCIRPIRKSSIEHTAQ